MNKPKDSHLPRDRKDILGEDPYEIEEVEEGKVWMVKYSADDGIFTTGELVEKVSEGWLTH